MASMRGEGGWRSAHKPADPVTSLNRPTCGILLLLPMVIMAAVVPTATVGEVAGPVDHPYCPPANDSASWAMIAQDRCGPAAVASRRMGSELAVCEDSLVPTVRLAIANNMFTSCNSVCLFEVVYHGEAFSWNKTSGCWQKARACTQPHERLAAIARGRHLASFQKRTRPAGHPSATPRIPDSPALRACVCSDDAHCQTSGHPLGRMDQYWCELRLPATNIHCADAKQFQLSYAAAQRRQRRVGLSKWNRSSIWSAVACDAVAATVQTVPVIIAFPIESKGEAHAESAIQTLNRYGALAAPGAHAQVIGRGGPPPPPRYWQFELHRMPWSDRKCDSAAGDRDSAACAAQYGRDVASRIESEGAGGLLLAVASPYVNNVSDSDVPFDSLNSALGKKADEILRPAPGILALERDKTLFRPWALSHGLAAITLTEYDAGELVSALQERRAEPEAAEAAMAAAGVAFPVVVKPSRQSGSSRQVAVVRRAADLEAAISAAGGASNAVVQEALQHPEVWSVFIIASRGRLLGRTCRVYTFNTTLGIAMGGSNPDGDAFWSPCEESEVDDAELVRFVNQSAYTGFLSFNFKKRPGRHPGVIDVNTRMGGSMAYSGTTCYNFKHAGNGSEIRGHRNCDPPPLLAHLSLYMAQVDKDSVDSHRNSNGVLEWFEEHYEQATEKEFVRLGAVLEHFNADNQFEMSKQNFFKFVKEHPILAANFKRQQKAGSKVIKNVLVRCKPRAPSGA